MIDHMVSNGYSGWFWDGMANTGGWASDDGSFLQIRSAYVAGPVRSWMMVTDSVEIAKKLAKMEEMIVLDDSLARKDPYAFLPGLRDRITYVETKELFDSLQASGIAQENLRLTFINLVERISQGSSIYAHEGRHAIDKKNNYSNKSEELEYTAKLSEIYFSEKPMLDVTAVMSGNYGDGTPHGNANLRVIKGIVKWMNKHQREIKEFDVERPTLPQLDKLTDRQLRAAVRSLDPMGN